MILEIISILAGIIFVTITGFGVDGINSLTNVVDPPSLIAILLLTLPILFRNGMGKDFIRGFKLLKRDYSCHLTELKRTLDAVEMMQKQLLCAGIIVTILSMCMLFADGAFLESSPDGGILMVNLSIIFLPIFYIAILEMLLLPVQIEAKRRIINYMGEEA